MRGLQQRAARGAQRPGRWRRARPTAGLVMADDTERACGAPEGAGARQAASELGGAARGVGDRRLALPADPDAASVSPDPTADVGEGLAVSIAQAGPLQPRWLRPAIVFTSPSLMPGR